MNSETLWRVIQNTGKRAVIARDTERKEIHRPPNMTLKEFVQALPHKSTLSDSDLISRFPGESSGRAAEISERKVA